MSINTYLEGLSSKLVIKEEEKTKIHIQEERSYHEKLTKNRILILWLFLNTTVNSINLKHILIG